MRLNRLHTYLLLGIVAMVFLIGGCSGSASQSEADSDFSFIYMSDTQADPESGDYSAWGEMLAVAAQDESKPAFIMIGGDLVNDGNDQQEWDDFFAAAGPVLQKLKLYPVPGNHDNGELFNTIFELSEEGAGDNKKVFYSFDYGDAHFTLMDSNYMGAANPEDIEWLENDLKASEKSYKIVMLHHPVWPAIDNPKDAERALTIRQHFVPIMEKYAVDLVLCGHQHVYMRSWPLLDGERHDEGIVYLMNTSGGKHYTPGSFDYVAKSIGSVPLYSIISVGKNGINIKTCDPAGNIVDSTKALLIDEKQQDMSIRITGDGIAGEKVFTLEELSKLPWAGFENVYSTINNWPSARFYAARGITVRSILKAAGVLETAQLVTFRSPDGYEASFTRKQLLDSPRYYYPQLETGSAEGAEAVEAIIAYEFKEGSADMAAALADKLCLIIGQAYPGEHNNPAFVAGVNEIIISDKPAEKWEQATTFPAAGKIAAGEKVKLQHKSLGLVKLHYTLDGTEPTELSPMYNVSTYQPELNVPINIEEDTTIKVLVSGYGRENSAIVTFDFEVK